VIVERGDNCELMMNKKDKITPYAFEPYYSEYGRHLAENVEDTSTIPDTRIGNTDWCACGHCPQMTTEHESYCCTESENVRNLKGGLTCITHHESFPSVILNKDTLQAARYQMMLHADNAARREALKKISNRLWRHIAYKQFVYWVNAWVPLGKKKRKVIPACVIAKIREEYGEEDDSYVGFQSAEGEEPDYFD
jgi:hypothetical protein